MLNFWTFLTLKEPLVVTFNKTRAPISRIYVSETSMSIPNFLGKLQFFWPHFSFFVLEYKLWKWNEWNVCTYFQKICSWTRYTNSRFIRDKSIFFVSHLRFRFPKIALKVLNFCIFFISKRTVGGYFWWNVCIHFQKVCIVTRFEHSKFVKKT